LLTKKGSEMPMMLEGKKIIVTGGASGIGRATAVLAASAGRRRCWRRAKAPT
jgi:NAD(P)-dependent dehydrogenase (short-subunit alcohol dehydrogenase family)